MTKFGRVENVLQRMRARLNKLDDKKVIALEDNWFRSNYYKAAYNKNLINMYNDET